ncbi:MAG: DUF4350 domain-containing protein [Bacteroidota bacterium]
MSRRGIIAVIAALFVLLTLAEVSRETPIDWRYSFLHDDTRPYGAAVAWRLFDDWFSVERVTQPPFVRLRALDAENEGTEQADTRTYVFVTDTFVPDPIETAELLDFVAAGNTVFVAAERIRGTFADTLGVVTRFSGRRPNETFDPESDPATQRWRFVRTDTTLRLASPSLAQDRPDADGSRFYLDAQVPVWRLSELDHGGATVLGTTADDWANFARLPVGDGQILLLTTPTVFANVVLLADDPDRDGTGEAADYLAAAMAYLPNQPVLWDSYYKPGRDLDTSPLRYVFATPALRWAYVLALVTVLLFFLLRARRWQRPVPVVTPPPNAMASFVESVGRLHHTRGDTQALATTQRRVILDRLRRRTHIDGLDLSDESAAQVAVRLGQDEDEVVSLFARLRRAESRAVSDDDLLELDRRLHALMQA